MENVLPEIMCKFGRLLLPLDIPFVSILIKKIGGRISYLSFVKRSLRIQLKQTGKFLEEEYFQILFKIQTCLDVLIDNSPGA